MISGKLLLFIYNQNRDNSIQKPMIKPQSLVKAHKSQITYVNYFRVII